MTTGTPCQEALAEIQRMAHALLALNTDQPMTVRECHALGEALLQIAGAHQALLTAYTTLLTAPPLPSTGELL